MKRRWWRHAAVAAVLLGVIGLRPEQADAAGPRTKVIINGELVPVSFNDGDSFRVLAGTYKDAKARLAGYNTLESFGPVHQWGGWTAKELYVIAKMATMHARKGIWECSTDGKADGYGRLLLDCPGLRKDLVRRGMAHAMTISDEPSDAKLLEAQHEAQAARRGIWAHGIPAFILTSIHSVEEDTEGRGVYNRLVSTEDGHSVKWRHENRYSECTKVCHLLFEVHEDKVAEVADRLASEEPFASLSPEERLGVVRDFAEFRHINRSIPEQLRVDAQKRLMSFATDGSLGEQSSRNGACMIHVDFKRRFGTGRASCLK